MFQPHFDIGITKDIEKRDDEGFKIRIFKENLSILENELQEMYPTVFCANLTLY
jgi:hypothetical protein